MSVTYSTIRRFGDADGCKAGGTITIPNADGDVYIILAPNSDFSGLTINWQSAPENGQTITIVSTNNITNITHAMGTLNRSFSQIKASGFATFIYDAVGFIYMASAIDLTVQSVRVALPVASSSGGNVVAYATDNGLVGGNALFSSIDYVDADFVDSNPNLGKGKAVISNANKTITIPVVQQTFNGVVVLGVTVLGSNTIAAAPNGTQLLLAVQGKLAIQ